MRNGWPSPTTGPRPPSLDKAAPHSVALRPPLCPLCPRPLPTCASDPAPSPKAERVDTACPGHAGVRERVHQGRPGPELSPMPLGGLPCESETETETSNRAGGWGSPAKGSPEAKRQALLGRRRSSGPWGRRPRADAVVQGSEGGVCTSREGMAWASNAKRLPCF